MRAAIPGRYADKVKSVLKPQEPLLPRWKAHRFACLFEIDRPESKSARTQILATELNKMLTAARDYVPKTFVRKYKEHLTPRENEKRDWITKFDKKKASDLNDFTFGFYGFQAPRGGLHRFLVQLIVPVDTNVSELIMNVNNHVWANKNGRRIMDIKEQALHSPKQVGWLFRSNYVMAASTELQDEFEKRGGIHFGVTFKSIPLRYGTKYNKDTAVKAICISTNKEDQETAWELLMEWYNTKMHGYPLGIPMRFVPSNDHPDIIHNPAAAQNISTLMERQRIFLMDMESIPCPSLAFPDERIGRGCRTLRHELMDITATTMGEEHLGAKLFHAISKKVAADGSTSFVFTYHKALEREAHSIISGLGPFIAKELKLDPDIFCYPHTISSSHDWDIKKRCVHNETTAYLADIAGGKDTDEEEDEENGSGVYSMNSKHKRESRRIMGLNDEETVKDITKKKVKKKTPVPFEIQDDGSAASAMSALSVYSSSTAASNEQKTLWNTITDQHEKMEEQESEIARLKALLAKQQIIHTKTPSQQDNPQDQKINDGLVGEKIPDGWEPEIAIMDEEDTVMNINNTKPMKRAESMSETESNQHLENTVDMSKIPSDSEEEIELTEEDFYDKDGNEISYLKEVSDEVDGLKFIARGAPAEIGILVEQYKKRKEQVFLSHPFQFENPNEEWVELFKILDKDKLKQSYDISGSKTKISSVRFNDQAHLQVYDPSSFKLPDTSRVLEDSDSNSNESDQSVEKSDDSHSSSEADSSGPSQHSGSSSSEDPNDEDLVQYKKNITVKKQRHSLLTTEILNEAKGIVKGISAGDGPGFDV